MDGTPAAFQVTQAQWGCIWPWKRQWCDGTDSNRLVWSMWAQGTFQGTAWLWNGSRRSPECFCWSDSRVCASGAGRCCTTGAGTVPCQPGCPWGTRVTAPCMSHRVFTHRPLDALLSHLCTHSGHSFPAQGSTTALLGTVWVKPLREKHQVRSGGNPSLQTGREFELAAVPTECKIILKALKQCYCSYSLCLIVVNADFWGDLSLTLSWRWEHKAFPDCQTALESKLAFQSTLWAALNWAPSHGEGFKSHHLPIKLSILSVDGNK